jgi:hypothetical protein
MHRRYSAPAGAHDSRTPGQAELGPHRPLEPGCDTGQYRDPDRSVMASSWAKRRPSTRTPCPASGRTPTADHGTPRRTTGPSPAVSPFTALPLAKNRRSPDESYFRAGQARALMFRRVTGRPILPLVDRTAQRHRTMSRCQRRMVSGVISSRIPRRRALGITPSRVASSALSAQFTVGRRGCRRCRTASWWRRIKISAVFHVSSRRDSRSHAASRVVRRNTNRRHMTGDHHGRSARRATLLVRAVDAILGTHRRVQAGHQAGPSTSPKPDTGPRRGLRGITRNDRCFHRGSPGSANVREVKESRRGPAARRPGHHGPCAVLAACSALT